VSAVHLDAQVPIVEPEIYIRRFATELGLGGDVEKISTDAVLMVQRMRKDWIATGRRPAGLVGAALFVACNMNGYRVSTKEIMFFVKVSEGVIKERYNFLLLAHFFMVT